MQLLQNAEVQISRIADGHVIDGKREGGVPVGEALEHSSVSLTDKQPAGLPSARLVHCGGYLFSRSFGVRIQNHCYLAEIDASLRWGRHRPIGVESFRRVCTGL